MTLRVLNTFIILLILISAFGSECLAARLIIGDAATTREGLHYIPYEDDFHFLCDPANRVDYLDFIKCIPLDSDSTNYISLGGYFRERYEFFEHMDFGSEPKNPDEYFTNRILFHGDFHLGDHFRLFIEPGSYTVQGDLGTPRPTDEDPLTFNQAFLDLRANLSRDLAFTFRPGRYEMVYGSGRLVDPREGPNTRQRWDGFKGIFKAFDAVEVDGFWTRPTLNNSGIFDDHGDPGHSFWGVYANTLKPKMFLGSQWDLYYLGYQSAFSSYEAASGPETRQTVGARWSGHSGNKDAIDYDFESDIQWGNVGSTSITAWQAAFQSGYTFSAPGGPRLASRGDFTSGGGDSGTIRTYNPLFPAVGPFSGEPSLFVPSDLLAVRPIFQDSLSPVVSLMTEWIFYWRTSTADGVYGPGLFIPSSGSTSRFVGSQPDFELIFQLDPYLSLFVYYSHIFTGSYLSDALGSGTKDMNYFSLWLSYKF